MHGDDLAWSAASASATSTPGGRRTRARSTGWPRSRRRSPAQPSCSCATRVAWVWTTRSPATCRSCGAGSRRRLDRQRHHPHAAVPRVGADGRPTGHGLARTHVPGRARRRTWHGPPRSAPGCRPTHSRSTPTWGTSCWARWWRASPAVPTPSTSRSRSSTRWRWARRGSCRCPMRCEVRRAIGYAPRGFSDELRETVAALDCQAEGGLLSCVKDMARWISFQLREDGGERSGAQVLAGPTLAEMHRPRYLGDLAWTEAWGISWYAVWRGRCDLGAALRRTARVQDKRLLRDEASSGGDCVCERGR